jgi:hypothetical protein
MSSFQGHLAGTALMLVAVGVVFGGRLAGWDRWLIVQMAGVALFFGLLPDIDTKSVVARVLYPLFAAAALVLLLFGRAWEAAGLLLLALVPVMAKHRGFFHSRTAMALAPGVVFVLPLVLGVRVTVTHIYLYLAGVAGYGTHLLVDGELFRRSRR